MVRRWRLVSVRPTVMVCQCGGVGWDIKSTALRGAGGVGYRSGHTPAIVLGCHIV